MAVAFMFVAAGVTPEQYDDTMKGIGREALDAPIPEGILAHMSGPSADGWRVVDVWESEEAAGRFYGSATFQAGASNLPPLEPVAVPLHRLEIYETVRQTG